MSKYEPRAAKIKEEAEKLGIKVSWSRRGSTVFVHVAQPPGNTFVAGVVYGHVKEWLRTWYPDVEGSSWGPTHGTFKVYDTWELLKADSDDRK